MVHILEAPQMYGGILPPPDDSGNHWTGTTESLRNNLIYRYLLYTKFYSEKRKILLEKIH